jgi:hypothetical protein
MSQDTETATTPPPSPQELAAALARYREASASVVATSQANIAACEEQRAAYAELAPLLARNTPLRDLLLGSLRDMITRKPWTVARLAAWTHRPPEEVAACLDALIADGLVRHEGNGYTAAP